MSPTVLWIGLGNMGRVSRVDPFDQMLEVLDY